MAKEAKSIFNEKFIDLMPDNLAVIDKNHKIVYANKGFIDSFGKVVGKDATSIKFAGVHPFPKGNLKDLFEGKTDKISYKTTYSLQNKKSHYTINAAKLDGNNDPEQIIVLANNISGTNHWQKEFNLLFEKVPAFISIIDKDHNIIRANDKFREYFGEVRGKHGYDGYHRKRQDIINCPAEYTFDDGEEHTSTIVGFTQNGQKIKLVVNSIPIAFEKDQVALTMEIAIDISEITLLQDQLQHAHEFYSSIIDNAVDAIVAITTKGKTQIINKEARRILAWEYNRKPGIIKIQKFMPDAFFKAADEDGMIVKHSELEITNDLDEVIPVKFSAFELRNKKQPMGKVAFFHDMSKLKSLEKEKVEAERKAVNYTFNTIGDNMQKVLDIQRDAFDDFKSILETENITKIKYAWSLLESRFEIRNMIAEIFLKYSKGFEIDLKMTNIEQVIDTVRDNCKKITDKLEIICEFNVNKIDDILTDSVVLSTAIHVVILNSIKSCLDSDIELGKIKLFVDVRQNHLIVDVYDNSLNIENSDSKFGFVTIRMLIEKLHGIIDVSDTRKDGNRTSLIIPLNN